ncbi:MAG: response regulator [Deltaproteobacteria bacterium]|jgi:chemotaxis family two-component system response regulator Rcp1|nr:response regulator [Deltaproteobacteria bacterium]
MTAPISVLLIEDNPGDAELIRDTLQSGRVLLDLTVIHDGTEALAYLLRQGPHQKARQPDLIMLDLNLPKVDGRAVLAAIKNEAHLRTIPVVVLTSSDAERDIVQSYALGANCFLSKPVELEAFQQVVRSIEGFWLTVVKLP